MTEILSETRTATDLMEAMSSLRRALRRRVGKVGRVSDLTDAQRELVRLVRRNPGVRIGSAASELRLAPNTVSTLVRSLIETGWLERKTDPEDSRSGQLYLSNTAEVSVAEWRDRRLAVLDDAMSKLPARDRHRVEAALPAIFQLVDRLEDGV